VAARAGASAIAGGDRRWTERGLAELGAEAAVRVGTKEDSTVLSQQSQIRPVIHGPSHIRSPQFYPDGGGVKATSADFVHAGARCGP
jgi:hypothetical protein